MAVATAVKLHLRASRLQEAAVVLQERLWVQEAVGDLARRGKYLLDVIATKSFNHAPSAGAAIIGSAGFLLPAILPTGVSANDSMQSLVADGDMGARRDYRPSSKFKLQSSQAQVAMAADMGGGSGGVSSSTRRGVATEASLTWPLEEDDYRWETDPNGGWLASFP